LKKINPWNHVGQRPSTSFYKQEYSFFIAQHHPKTTLVSYTYTKQQNKVHGEEAHVQRLKKARSKLSVK